MSAEDEQSQSGYEDGLAGGPGAPTPLSALEVQCSSLLLVDLR
jgi:DNA repair protein RAD51